MSEDRCLTADQLRKLLQADSSGSDDDPQVLAHVETCTDCRHALDQLAGSAAIEESINEIRSAYDFYQASMREKKTSSSLAFDQTQTSDFISQLLAEIGVHGASSDLDSSDWPVVGRIGNVDLQHLLGQGGMGVVLKGRDSILDRDVAVKIIKPAWSRDQAARQRFLQEARLAASINHPNVVKIHAIDDSGKTLALIMEFVDGTSLQDLVGQSARPDESKIQTIARQAAEGLAAAHAKKIIHRDIKPGNLMMDKNTNQIKVADFGLAFASERTSYITSDGVVLGTPEYMSPEQIRGQPLDARSDLFSLGAVLYELCTGKLPFPGQTVMTIAYNVVNERFTPIKQVNPEISDEFAEIVERLLNKTPASRFQSARQLIEALEDVGDGNVAPPSSPVHRLAAIAGIILVAVAGIYGITNFPSIFNKTDRATENFRTNLNNRLISIDGRDNGFATLSTAIQSAKPNDTILLQGGMDYRLELRDIQTQVLTIRGTGQHAKIILAEPQADGYWLSVTGDLILENIDLELPSQNRRREDRRQSAIAVNDSGKLQLQNCRVVATGFTCAFFLNQGTLQLTDSSLFAAEAIGVASQSRGINKLLMENSLVVADNAMVWSFDSRSDLADEEISLTGSTFRANTILKLHQDRRGGSPSKKPTPIRVASERTIFSGDCLIEIEPRRFGGTDRPFSDFLNFSLDWRGKENLYSEEIKFFETNIGTMDVDPKTVADWSQFWEDREQRSVQDQMVFTGGKDSIEEQDHLLKNWESENGARGRIGFKPKPDSK